MNRYLGFVGPMFGIACLTLPIVAHTAPAPVADALDRGYFGLHETNRFRIVEGSCPDCATPRQALWYFQDDLMAVPRVPPAPYDLASRLPIRADIARWSASESHDRAVEPFLVWLGAPEVIVGAHLDPDGRHVRVDSTAPLRFDVVSKIATNRSYYDASSVAFLSQRKLRLRGRLYIGEAAGPRFVARAVWPEDFRLDYAAMAAQPLAAGETIARLIEAEDGGVRSPFFARVLWERTPGAARALERGAVLGLMLNGAQGDDDEAHGGHFAVVTGRHATDGRIDEWLVNNFYNLGSVSEKGIIAAMLPMDNYLADLNSGQSWYRPSYMLVAVLKDARVAVHYQNAINRVYERFYRRHVEYDHAQANCAGISAETLAGLGWQIPELGPTSVTKAYAGYFYSSAKNLSFESGRKTYEYLLAERSRLYPRVAFETAGAHLLDLLAHPSRADTRYERTLVEDVIAVVFVRIPQLPSSRAFGTFPVASFDDYMARVPADRSQWKIIPVDARPFPEELRDRPAERAMLSDTTVGVLAWAGAGGVAVLPVAWWWRAKKKKKA